MCLKHSVLFTVTTHRDPFFFLVPVAWRTQSTSEFAFDPHCIRDACLGGAFYIYFAISVLLRWRGWEVSKSSICVCHHTPIFAEGEWD